MVGIGPLDKTGPSTRFYAYADVLSQNVGGNFSTIRLQVHAYNGPSGSTGSWYGGSGGQSCSIDAIGISMGHYAGSNFLPSGYAQNQLRWADAQDFNVGHDGNGYLGGTTSHSVRMGIAYDVYSENYYATLGVPRIPKAPATPGAPTASAIGTTGMSFSWSLPNNNGAGLDQMLLRRYDDAALTIETNYIYGGGVTSAVITGLNPGTTYYWALYAHNSVGYSARSAVTTQATLPSSPPILTVAPSLTGQSATLTFAPPGGVSGVTEYNFEYRVGSGGAVTAGSSTTTTATVSGLTPGSVVQWRANAEIGGYTSPWSDWAPVSQPNPNTNPGDYYDGATAAVADLTYAWSGTANNSTTIATGKGVKGWSATFGGSSNGVLHQVTGGFAGAYAARVSIDHDCTAAGQIHAGMALANPGRADVEASTVYTVSIYVKPSRSQRMAVRFSSMNAAGTEIGSPQIGAGVVCPANVWTRLSVTVTTPALTEYGAVRAIDVAGTGHSVWLAGQSFLVDAAMISMGDELLPFFDGDTPDSAMFLYTWFATANESPSYRTAIPDAVADPLADPDCTPIPSPPRPPMIPSDCIDEVGAWRRYTLQIQSVDVPLWGSAIPTLILSTSGSAERQVRIRFYPNPDGVAPDQIDLTEWKSEQIVTYIPPNAVMTLDGVARRAWAEVAGKPAVAADRLLFGTGGVPAEWPELDCGYGYIATLDVPLEAPPGNLTTQVLLTQKV